MKWGDFVLRLLVRRRDRETISGDLLEEYRDHVLPTRGSLSARLWYIRQILSFVSPIAWGFAIGVVLGTWQLVNTVRAPLADDDAGEMLFVVAVIVLLWTSVSVATSLPTGRFRDAVVAGMLAGLATMAVFDATSILRVNVFLERIRYRDDWVGLIARFDASNAPNLRAYANWEYVRGTPMVLAIGVVVGGLCGALAGVINRSMGSGGKRHEAGLTTSGSPS
jgi:H+/Cl- antiporter ClcA